ncbi:type II toxin-antitoxin system RatA family toxin [Nocardia sp. BMG51109]|uniref:type II toxin-antitoxin system RatA family toxin n=1 Tax=Nocardia sp. BMG51109 TaxID=1056816 RepID=UPI0004651F6F|nr:SRPBCC family protein [Nocardia sp. BMG51109]
MKNVRIECLVKGYPRQEVYETLKDAEVYRRNAPDRVKHVETVASPDGRGAVTNWDVYFRNGLLSWSERDFYDDDNYLLTFEQIDGDFDTFEGSWSTREGDEAGEVRLLFEAAFDFGVPSLESIVAPVAVRVLTQTMSNIVLQVFPGSSIL